MKRGIHMPSLEKFRKSLESFNVDKDTITRSQAGFENLTDKATKPKRAAYFKHAVDVLSEELSAEKFQEIFEWNACCKGGAKEKASKTFAKENAHLSLEEKLAKIKSVPYMGDAHLNQDGTITLNAVSWFENEKFHCACSNFSKIKRDYPVSKNYCFCCSGHFLHHYQIMLGQKLKTLEIISSPLDSDGTNSCVMRFAIIEP